MLDQFIENIKKKQLFTANDKVLLAVSGGVDSTVMADLFHLAGYNFSIVHCNYQLRGEDSDDDALFVQDLCDEYDVPFYYTNFETERIAKERKQSIQRVARDLRYDFFKELCKRKGYNYIATAHHHNDSIETCIINLSKGCGLRGLHGIPEKNQGIIRPLLSFTKEEIRQYAHRTGLDYREDISNGETKYTRNKIRHLVIPQLKQINPGLENTFKENIARFQEAEWLIDFAFDQLKKQLVSQEGKFTKIELEGLKTLPVASSFLFLLLEPLHYNASQIKRMIRDINGIPGAIYPSPSHEILRDRTHLIIRKKPSEEDDLATSITKAQIEEGIELENMSFSLSTVEDVQAIKRDPQSVFLDMDKLNFPLCLRTWKQGDFFFPHGMRGKKKLSKYYKEQGFNRFVKDEVLLICDAEEQVLSVIGYRDDRRFMLNKDSKTVLQIKKL